jgi:hypothetical protein
LGPEVDGLLRRTAPAVDRDTGNVFGKPGDQPRRPGKASTLWADGVDVADHHIVDLSRVDPGAFDESLHHPGAEVGWVEVGETAVTSADRRPVGDDPTPLATIRR